MKDSKLKIGKSGQQSEVSSQNEVDGYKIGEIVPVKWFGSIAEVKVIGNDPTSDKVQCQFEGHYGSFYTTPEEIQFATAIRDRLINGEDGKGYVLDDSVKINHNIKK